jgi:uncharacterized protein YbjQ (UPF0145 family)
VTDAGPQGQNAAQSHTPAQGQAPAQYGSFEDDQGDGSGLPAAARDRLAASASAQGSWTSDLSVAELSAVRRVGFRPAGMVVGMSVYQIAIQGIGPSYFGLPAAGWGSLGQGMGAGWTPAGFRGYFKGYPCMHAIYGMGHGYGVNFEDLYYEQALSETFRLALDRLREEAAALGAHGVVGVRHTITNLPIATTAPVIELKMIGTAIRRPSAPPLDQPFTSHLSGQQFAKLISTGWMAAGLVYGVGSVRSMGGCVGGLNSQTASGAEFVQRSEAVHEAQRIAVAEIEERARDLGEQAVGVDVSITARESGESAMSTMYAIGTAVRRFRDHEHPPAPEVYLRMSDHP